MRRVFVLPLMLAMACSSSTSPNNGTLNGTWTATRATLRPTVQEFSVTLHQVGDSITGTAVLRFIGDGPTYSFQVAGRTGLNGTPCNIDVQFDCHAQFQFRASQSTTAFIDFVGGFTADNKIVGDVFSTSDFPFTNIDGEELDFTR